MNYCVDILLYALRKAYRTIARKKNITLLQNKHAKLNQQGCDIIFDTLSNDKPCFIGRFGSIELSVVCTYLNIINNTKLKKKFMKKMFEFITIKQDVPFYWSRRIRQQICQNAGFFPIDVVVNSKREGAEMLEKFAELYLDCIPHVDVISSIYKDEMYIMDKIPNVKIVGFNCLEPYLFDNPWSRVLKEKKVLVIHPLANTIEMQYKNREKIFKNPEVLPNFYLKTVKAVNSIAGNYPSEYTDWFDALDGMKKQISKEDFDIALLGCGAYAIPLAKYVKDIGKKSITICGALQILFGIKGRRWETEYDYDKKFYNDFWVYPSVSDRPKNFEKVENGCYW
jgi:hypothetical protein